MKKVLISLVVALMLVMLMAVPATAVDQQTVPASATVTEYISITVADEAPTGITFGGVDLNTTDNPDQTTAGFDTSGSVTVYVEPESTVNVDVKISGTDFSASPSWPITDAKYSLTYAGAKIAMSTTLTFVVSLAPSASQMLWHWLDVPSGIPAGQYSSTFTYQGVKTGT